MVGQRGSRRALASQDSPSTKAVIGRSKHKLVDTRPPERNVTWTLFYGKEDSYNRIDFLSPGPAWHANESRTRPTEKAAA